MASYRFNVGVGWVVVDVVADADTDAASSVEWMAEEEVEVDFDMTDGISDEWWLGAMGGLRTDDQHHSSSKVSRCMVMVAGVHRSRLWLICASPTVDHTDMR
jgi:hypothetical protein